MLISFALFSQFPSPTRAGDPGKASNSNSKSVTVEGITLNVPSNWNKSGNQNLWTDGKGNSVNIISESAPTYTLKAYVDLSLVNMKKMIKTYKVISETKGKGTNVDYIGYFGEYSLTEVGAKSGSIKIYSLFVDAKDTKYVVTIGGLPDNFKQKDIIFKKIMKSITLNSNFKKVVNNKGGVKVIAEKVSINVPDGWVKSEGRDMWIDPVTNSSVNMVTENAAAYTLESYLELSLTNMKKMIPSYVLIKKSYKQVNGNKIGVLLGEFTMSNMNIKLYSVVLDIAGMKYVLSIGGPKKSFDSLNKTFENILNSFKKL
jgi:hypothetical protein